MVDAVLAATGTAAYTIPAGYVDCPTVREQTVINHYTPQPTWVLEKPCWADRTRTGKLKTMDTKTLTVGQKVCVNGGYGLIEGKVVKIEPPCVYVEANGLLRFNRDGKECDLNGIAYTYNSNPMFGPGPWEIDGS